MACAPWRQIGYVSRSMCVSVNIREREEKKRQLTKSQRSNTGSTGEHWHLANSNCRIFPPSEDIVD